jgi:hypothetical protein
MEVRDQLYALAALPSEKELVWAWWQREKVPVPARNQTLVIQPIS